MSGVCCDDVLEIQTDCERPGLDGTYRRFGISKLAVLLSPVPSSSIAKYSPVSAWPAWEHAMSCKRSASFSLPAALAKSD